MRWNTFSRRQRLNLSGDGYSPARRKFANRFLGWGSWGAWEIPVLFAQRLQRSNEVVGFAAPAGLGGSQKVGLFAPSSTRGAFVMLVAITDKGKLPCSWISLCFTHATPNPFTMAPVAWVEA